MSELGNACAGPVPALYRQADREARIRRIAESFARLTGRPLIDPAADDAVAALWHASDVIVAHGVEDDPVFFFGNAAALAAFETDLDDFTRMPSRLSAEAPDRAERQRLLDRVSRAGFIDDYAGVRVTRNGRRFRIEQAIVWNLLDAAGVRHGQAATFRR